MNGGTQSKEFCQLKCANLLDVPSVPFSHLLKKRITKAELGMESYGTRLETCTHVGINPLITLRYIPGSIIFHPL